MTSIEGLDHIALTVRDVARSVEWYQRVLGLERRHEDAWGDHPAIVGAGTTALALFPSSVPDPRPQQTGREHLSMRHVAFRADRRGFEAMQQHLTTLGIAFTSEDHQISWSIYFQDPDGYEIEVTTYEAAG